MPSKNCQSQAKLSTARHLEKRGIERSLEKLDQSGRCTVNVLIPRSGLALLSAGSARLRCCRLLSLSTIAGSETGKQPWVIFQAAPTSLLMHVMHDS